MHRIDHATAVANMHGQGKPGFTGGDPTNKIPATRLTPAWTNDLQENICRAIEAAGIELVKGDGGQLAAAIQAMIAGAFTGIEIPTIPDIPADIPFIAGYSGSGAGKDLAVQFYGSVKLARAITIQGEAGVLGLAGTGADVMVDIERNGGTVYITKPKFMAGVTVLTAGVLDVTKVACAAGDVLAFRVTQKGSTIAGQQLRFTLKAKVS